MAWAPAARPFYAKKHHTTPRGVYENHIQELQALVLKLNGMRKAPLRGQKIDLAPAIQVTPPARRAAKLGFLLWEKHVVLMGGFDLRQWNVRSW